MDSHGWSRLCLWRNPIDGFVRGQGEEEMSVRVNVDFEYIHQKDRIAKRRNARLLFIQKIKELGYVFSFDEWTNYKEFYLGKTILHKGFLGRTKKTFEKYLRGKIENDTENIEEPMAITFFVYDETELVLAKRLAEVIVKVGCNVEILKRSEQL